MLYRVRARRPASARLIAAGLLVGCATILSVAIYVHPDARGVGSHRQLGAPACPAIVLFGFPCPSCGMTTAFAHTVRGQLWSAFQAQPAGLLLALTTTTTLALSLSVLLTGRVWRVNWYRVPPTRVTVAALLALLFGWAYKVIAGLITGTLPFGE